MVEKITKWKIRVIGLYRHNYLATFYVREMAKKLKTSHSTLFPHLKDLEKDKILVPEIVGKNKVYSLNLDNISTKEQLVIAEKFETLKLIEKQFFIKKLYDDIIKLNLKGCVIIFGSHVKGYQTEVSDIDLFYFGDITDKQIDEIKRIGAIYNKNVNVKKSSFNNFEEGLRKRDPLIREIVEDHVILQNPDFFVNILWRYYNEIR